VLLVQLVLLVLLPVQLVLLLVQLVQLLLDLDQDLDIDLALLVRLAFLGHLCKGGTHQQTLLLPDLG
jgi:hypothetical protein